MYILYERKKKKSKNQKNNFCIEKKKISVDQYNLYKHQVSSQSIMTSPQPSLTAIERETQSIKQLNELIQHTIGSLSSISDNLNVFHDNLSNSNKLSKIYSDIYIENKSLNETLLEINNSNIEKDEELDTQISSLESQIADLKNQLNS